MALKRTFCSRYSLYNRILVVLFLVAGLGCDSTFDVSVHQRQTCSADTSLEACPSSASMDLTFKITSIKKSNNDGYTIAWQKVPQAKYFDLIIAKDEQCKVPFLEFNALPISSQAVTVHSGSGYHVCVYAHIGEHMVAATNNGMELKDGAADDTSFILPATNLKIIRGQGKLNLSWSRGDTNTTGYIVVRRSSSAVSFFPKTGQSYLSGILDANHTVVYSGTATSFEDTSVSAGINYHYSVFAYNNAKNYASATAASAAPNITPTLSFTFSSAMLAESSISQSLTFSASDPDDDAKITLYYKLAGSTGCNSSGIGGWTEIVHSLPEDSTSHSWDISALGVGTYYICGKIEDTLANAVYTLSSNAVTLNVAPTISMENPVSSVTEVGQTSTYAITWTDADSDDNATISIYYKANNTGACDTGTAITTGLSEDANGTAGSYTWSPLSVSVGTYYICARISDGVNPPVDSWSGGQITINAKPTFTWVVPVSTTFVNATNVDLEWTDSDPDDDAQIDIRFGTNTPSNCTTWGTSLASGLSEDSTTNTYTWDTSSLASSSYNLCALITDGVNTAQVTNASYGVVVYRKCVWTGTTDGNWHDASNWTSCNGVVPTGWDWVLIPSSASNQPTVSASTAVYRIFEGNGGGTITVNAGVNLRITTEIASDITLKGDTSTCKTCIVSGGMDISVINDATLTLDKGIGVDVRYLGIGGEATAGHLVATAAGSNTDEYLSILASRQITVSGTSAQNSTVKFDGVYIGGQSTAYEAIRTYDYVDLVKFDNVTFRTPSAVRRYPPFIYIHGCSTTTVSDLNWSNIVMNAPAGSENIDVSKCSGIGPINISGSGMGFGQMFAHDPNNVLNWVDSQTAATCTWNGSVNSSWIEPLNWTNCVNGRGDYPDQLDSVIIANTGIQPVITTDTLIQSFAADPGGGGTITVNAGAALRVFQTTPSVASSVNLQGDNPSCTTCEFYFTQGYPLSKDTTIANNATLGLGTGITVRFGTGNGIQRIQFGDGVTAGHLKTIHSSTAASEWPLITNAGYQFTSLVFQGGATKSRFDVSGLRIIDTTVFYPVLHFSSNYQISRYDHLYIDTYGIGNGTQSSYTKLENCNTATFTDLLWENIHFYDAPQLSYYNIDAGHASCNGVGPITINGDAGSGGYGSSSENDPFNILNWN